MITISQKQISKTCTSRLCTSPFTRPLWVETAISRLWHRHLTGPKQVWKLQKNVLPYPSRHISSQHPSDWVPQGHRGRQNRQHTKRGRKVHQLHKRSSHSPHTNPMESGPGTTFSAQNRKKTKKFVIFGPKKGGSFFFDIFAPPPPPPPSLKTSKKWVSSGGEVWRGPDQKLIGGCVYWTK